MEPAAPDICDVMADMAPQQGVKLFESLLAIIQCNSLHLFENVRVTADRPLSEDDQAPGENVCALDRDPDRDGTIRGLEVILWTDADRFAAVHVHGVVHAFAHAFGRVILHDAGGDARMMPIVEADRDEAARSFQLVGRGTDRRELLLNTLKLADIDTELFTHASIGAGRLGGDLASGCRQ